MVKMIMVFRCILSEYGNGVITLYSTYTHTHSQSIYLLAYSQTHKHTHTHTFYRKRIHKCNDAFWCCLIYALTLGCVA